MTDHPSNIIPFKTEKARRLSSCALVGSVQHYLGELIERDPTLASVTVCRVFDERSMPLAVGTVSIPLIGEVNASDRGDPRGVA